jgi:hypothetical protein
LNPTSVGDLQSQRPIADIATLRIMRITAEELSYPGDLQLLGGTSAPLLFDPPHPVDRDGSQGRDGRHQEDYDQHLDQRVRMASLRRPWSRQPIRFSSLLRQ